jgi:hypothetical protein
MVVFDQCAENLIPVSKFLMLLLNLGLFDLFCKFLDDLLEDIVNTMFEPIECVK